MASFTVILAVIRAARPQFRSAHDKVAFAVHASIMAQGFKLVAVGEQPALKLDAALAAKEVPPDGWNASPDCCSFQYSKKGPPSHAILLKAVPAEDLLVVSALVNGEEPKVVELLVARYTRDAGDSDDVADMFDNLDELAAKVATLLPNIAAATAKMESTQATQQTFGTGNPASHPTPPDPPSGPSPLVEDRQPPDYISPMRPAYVGREDFDPLAIPGPGGMPPFMGGIPSVMPGGGFGGGGMHVGPDHQIFQGRVRHPRMGGLVAPPGMPPGVRWDPVRPEGLEGWNPEDFQRPRPPGNHPDLEFRRQEGTDWDNMFG